MSAAAEGSFDAGATGITLELKNIELRGNDGVWAAGNYSVVVKDKTIQGNWFRILKRESGTWKVAMEAFARAGAIDDLTTVWADEEVARRSDRIVAEPHGPRPTVDRRAVEIPGEEDHPAPIRAHRPLRTEGRAQRAAERGRLATAVGRAAVEHDLAAALDAVNDPVAVRAEGRVAHAFARTVLGFAGSGPRRRRDEGQRGEL